MPKGVKTLEKELHETKEILKHHEYHRRVGDLRKLPSKTDLEARITKLEKALEKAKSKSGGTRRRHRHRTRSTRRRGGSFMSRDAWTAIWKAKPENQGLTDQAANKAYDAAAQLAQDATNLVRLGQGPAQKRTG